MRSIERRFNIAKKKNPHLGSYCLLNRAITGQRFSRATIRKWFHELVDKDDYNVKEKGQLLKNLYKM